MRSFSAIRYAAFLGLLAFSLESWAQPPATLTIPAKLRDIKECVGTSSLRGVNNCTDNANPDFQNIESCPDVGYVETTIATDRPVDSATFPLDNRSPVKSAKMSSSTGKVCYTSAENFETWFNDKIGPVGSATDINRPFLMDLTLTRGTD